MVSNNFAASGASQYNTKINVTLFSRITEVVKRKSSAVLAVIWGSSPTNGNFNLWLPAYKLVQQHESELMANYKKHLEMIYVERPLVSRDLLDPHHAECMVKQLVEFREKDEIHLSFPSTNTEMRVQIEKLAKFFIWSNSIVKSAATTQPHVALAWSGVSLFLLLLTNSTAYNKAMIEGFNAICDIQIFWRSYGESYLESPCSEFSQNLEDDLTELYSFIIEYQARAVCYVAKPKLGLSYPSEYTTGFNKWDEIMAAIQKSHKTCLGHINEWQEAEIRRNSKETLQEIQKSRIIQERILGAIEESTQDTKERQLLNDLAKASADYARYKDINPDRVSGTCEWFLTDKRFCNWRDSRSRKLLWVSAGPGCGKSVLSKSLIDEGLLNPEATITISSSTIVESDTAVCYFFFKEAGEGQMDIAQALCAILHQLFKYKSTSSLITYALSSHKNNGQTMTERTNELWRILVECANSSPIPIICLLDALDECKEDRREELITMLQGLYHERDTASIPAKLKFLITSRPYDDLKSSFDRLSSAATYLHFDGDDKSGQIGQEINLVINDKMKHIAGTFSDEDREKISERLKSMENRTYLWLHLTLNIIEKSPSAHSRCADIEQLLSGLPSKVADAYEKILSRSQDDRKVKALLQIVLAATRPLTLDEANCALALALEKEDFLSYKKLQEKLWPKDNFKMTVQNLCGLFISIHDSKLSFIHQTAREFLIHRDQRGVWMGRLDMSKSHGILSGACINYLQILDPSCQDPKLEYPLFSYAAESWCFHFRLQDADSTATLRKSARELCRFSAPQTKFWRKHIAKSYFEDGWTDLHLASSLGLAAVTYDIIVHEHADVNAERRWGTPLREAIEEGHLEVMEVLLDPAHGVKIGEKDIVYAVHHESNAEAIMALLLDKRGNEVKITGRVLIEAVGNKSGAAVMALLLSRRGNEVEITEWVVSRAAQWGSIETMTLLLDERGHEFEITEEIVKGATNNDKDMFTLLLKRRGHEIKITEAVILEAMSTFYPETLDLLLDLSNEIKITEGMAAAAAEVYKGSEIIRLLLDKRGSEITITEDIVKAAVRNNYHGTEIITFLLDNRGHEITITEDIVKAAVQNSRCGLEIMPVLLDRRRHEIIITEDIIMVAQGRERGKDEMIALLQQERDGRVNITEVPL